ncbi:MAG: chorismate synthase [Bacteroidota bacterium]|nr:chorismate synthase [Bacteroidota bacterium]
MAGNTFGTLFRLTSFGESHGEAIGGIVDGCPSGIAVDMQFIKFELNRRKPKKTNFSTSRQENDVVEFLSGIFEGKTTGTPIAFLIRNNDHKSNDYDHVKEAFRPSHADFVYQQKYGLRDYRGGGRASARETVARVVAGAIAKLVLKQKQIEVTAFVSSVGKIALSEKYLNPDFNKIEENILRCPDSIVAAEMEKAIEIARDNGDTLGGTIRCICKNIPVGLGEPVFDKLHAELGKAMLGINAVKGFEYGIGFDAAKMTGSEHNDIFVMEGNKITTKTNNSGGIQGGISNGKDIFFKVAFKPVPTIMKTQNSVDKNGDNIVIKGKGRHDVCVVPRAVPIVEAMAAIVLLDYLLINNAYNFKKHLL